MTTIQPYQELRAEVRETMAPQPTTGNNRRLAWFAGAALLALTAMNLGAAAHLAGAIAELRGAEERLAKLSAFERRILQRLEVVNDGVHSQFDNLLRVTDSRLEQLRRELEAAPNRARAEPVFAADSAGTVKAVTGTVAFENIVEPPGAPLVEASAGPAPKPPLTRRSGAAPNPAYQRIEGPNGKVTYRKLD